MKFRKSFKHALDMVMHSKLRSWLTIIGIVIGVASVIAILSMGQGLQAEVDSRIGVLGNDLLTITAGASRAGNFEMHGPGEGGGGGGSAVAIEDVPVLARTDLQALKGLGDIALIDTNIRGSADVYYLGKKGSVSVTGVDTNVWSQITIKTIITGRTLGPGDANVVVIGGRIANEYFDVPLGVNQMIAINDRAYRVVGILDDESRDIIMPIDNAYDLLEDKTRGIYDTFIVKVKDETALETTMATIDSKLSMVRHIGGTKKKNFSIMSNAAQQARMADMMSSITIFLAAIASVALLVGAIGIANTMFTSVLERTKQIGIMKAIGARNSDIMAMFMMNSAIIGLIGGVIGVVIGIFLSGLLPGLLGSTGGVMGRFGSTGALVSIKLVLYALLISVGVGVLSGAIPAYKASKLKPVDALRWE